MGQTEVKPLRERSIFIDQISCPNKNSVLTGVMAKAHKQINPVSEYNSCKETQPQQSQQPPNGKENNYASVTPRNHQVSTDTSITASITKIKSTHQYNPSAGQIISQRQLTPASMIQPSSILILKPPAKSINSHQLVSQLKPSNGGASQQQSQSQLPLLKSSSASIRSSNIFGKQPPFNSQLKQSFMQTEPQEPIDSNQIAKFHRQISESIKKDFMNASTVSIHNNNNNNRESVRGTERFSVARMSTRSVRQSVRQQQDQSQEQLELIRLSQKPQRARAPTKSKIKVNCSLIEQFSNLPELCQRRIVNFLFDQQPSLRLINSIFYYKLSEIIESQMVELDNQFIKSTMRFLSFRDSYLTQTPTNFKNLKGYRIDRHIIGQVLPAVKGCTVKISYSYKYVNKKKTKYCVEYQFDALEDKKTVWAFKEDCRHNFDESHPTFVQPITAVRVGDNIKITVNFYSLNGLVDLKSIVWKEPVIEVAPKIPIMIDYNEIDQYEANRICEIEQLYTTWSLFDYFYNDMKCQLDFFEPILHLKETRCAGVDLITSKLIFIASKPGVVPKSQENFGVHLKVVDSNEEAVSSVKRLGVFSDDSEPATIHLRVGDVFVFYIARGD